MRKAPRALALALAVLGIGASNAQADNSWGSYHWARTANPFTLALGNNMTGGWTTSPSGASFLSPVSADWSKSSVLDTSIVSGARLKRCGAVSGRVEVCNSTYGRNGWLGLASIWASGGHITKATVKLNDTYFNTTTYNTPAWRQSVLCQEVGHTFGLDHQSEDSEVDMNTCMDYYEVPNVSPNTHDYDQLAAIYSGVDTTTTVGATSTTKPGNRFGLRRLRDDLYVEDLGGGVKRFVWVFWKDRGVRHVAPAGA